MQPFNKAHKLVPNEQQETKPTNNCCISQKYNYGAEVRTMIPEHLLSDKLLFCEKS